VSLAEFIDAAIDASIDALIGAKNELNLIKFM
jgi:hypothetical protein